MRKSQKVLLTAAGTLILGILVVGAMGRIALSHFDADADAVDEARRSSGSSADRVSRSYDLEGFQGLDVDGAWQVSITQGEAWRVQLAYPEAYEDEIEVEIRGDELRLDRNTSRRWRWWGRDDAPIAADIMMPELTRLSSKGASDLHLAGFEGTRLEIEIAGAVQLEGLDGRYDEIDLSVAGASQIDLRGVVATDARVDLAGASDIELTLDGGVLSGSMAGAGSVEYYGSAAEQRIDIAGIGRVRHAD